MTANLTKFTITRHDVHKNPYEFRSSFKNFK
jgi:hypothetical protein